MARVLGSPKTGGRTKGTPNRPSLKDLAAKLAAEGETPLEFMIRVMRTPMPVKRKDEDEADFLKKCREHFSITREMATAAAPYMHPRLQTTVIEGDKDKPLEIKVDLDEGARRIAFILAKAARSKP